MGSGSMVNKGHERHKNPYGFRRRVEGWAVLATYVWRFTKFCLPARADEPHLGEAVEDRGRGLPSPAVAAQTAAGTGTL